MVKRINKNHYVATPGETTILPDELLIDTPEYHHRQQRISYHHHKGYYTDGEESRAPSERTMSEYTTNTNNSSKKQRPRRSRSQESRQSRQQQQHSREPHYEEGSDIYVTTAAYRPPSEMSRGSRCSHHSRAPSPYSYRSGIPVAPSEGSTIKTKITRRPGVTIETMSAPNPFCPNTRGICCLMVLLNLGLILVTLGFVIVIQFFEPLFVWVLGIVFLIFGFMTLMGSLIYCVYVCRDVKTPKQVAMEDPYWTHHWQKSFGATPPPELHYKMSKYPPPSEHDRYSDRYSERHKNRY